jgi:Ni,Fe-hydrogenase maturation factor
MNKEAHMKISILIILILCSCTSEEAKSNVEAGYILTVSYTDNNTIIIFESRKVFIIDGIHSNLNIGQLIVISGTENGLWHLRKRVKDE